MVFFVYLVINHGLLSFPFLENELPSCPTFKTSHKDGAVGVLCCLEYVLHGQTWLVSVLETMMKIQGWSSPSWLCLEDCFLSNLFLLSLLLGEVMQLFIHNESMSFLGFDRDINDFGEVWQHISVSLPRQLFYSCLIFAMALSNCK